MGLLVKDYLGKKGRKGNIGIEIEVEADQPLPVIKGETWISKPEGSLRKNGMEYLTNGPLSITEISSAISSLNKHLKGYKIDHKSPRTSVHMHANVMYNTPVQYWTMATAYWLTENLLFDFCGDYRKGNCFCLRLSDAEGVIPYCIADLKSDLPFKKLSTDNIRYGGQNLAATGKFGSIEYRGLSFTLDADRISTWANAIYDLNLNSRDFKSPDALLDTYFRDEPTKFLSRIFSRKFCEVLQKSRNWQDKLDDNAGILCELAYHHDWDKWSAKIEKNASKVKIEEIKYDDIPDGPIIRVNQVDWGQAVAQAQAAGIRIRG